MDKALLAMLMGTTAVRSPEGTDAPAPVVEPAPVETPAAPALEPAKSVETIVAEPAKPVEPAAAESAKPGPEKPSLLSEPPKPDAKPAEAAPAEAKPVEPVVEKPTYQPFTLPEGVKADEGMMGKFTDLLGTNKLTQEQGQSLIDLHTNAMKAQADHLAKEQWKSWNEMQGKWVDEIRADKEFGGNKFDTSTQAAKRMIDLLVKKDELEGFNQFMDTTGAGNNPWMFKILNRVAQWLDEPVAPRPAAKPAKGNGRASGARGLRAMYKDAAQ